MKKILNKIIMLLLATTMGLLSILNTNSYAVSDIEANKTNLYSKGVCDRYLKYRGIAIKTTFVVYNDGNTEYPSYCLNVDLPGVGEVGEYSVSTKDKITDVKLWKTIINGYPYKTLAELGVETKEEAYTATKQAIYCTLYNRNVEEYEANGAKGKNTLQALKQILENANNEIASQVANRVTIVPDCDIWEQDELNKEYVSKKYYIKADAGITSYKVKSDETFPEGAIITDLSNNKKDTYQAGEKFKVLIPISSLINDGNFNLDVETAMNTKPVIYGKSMIAGVQDYALTAYSYEDATGEYIDNYTENKTKIRIVKKDEDTKELLSKVEFAVLDEELNEVYSGLLTDENGEIIIENVIPGKYYLKEIKSLQDYMEFNELIDIKINLNEELTITVNNKKEEKKQENKTFKENIEITQKQVKKLPVTGM